VFWICIDLRNNVWKKRGDQSRQLVITCDPWPTDPQISWPGTGLSTMLQRRINVAANLQLLKSAFYCTGDTPEQKTVHRNIHAHRSAVGWLQPKVAHTGCNCHASDKYIWILKTCDYIQLTVHYCVLFSSRIRVRIRVGIGFGVWSVSCYAHVLTAFVIVGCNCHGPAHIVVWSRRACSRYVVEQWASARGGLQNQLDSGSWRGRDNLWTKSDDRNDRLVS